MTTIGYPGVTEPSRALIRPAPVGETCAKDCPGWTYDRRGRIRPCMACGFENYQAFAAAQAFCIRSVPGAALYCHTGLDSPTVWTLAVLADDFVGRYRTDEDARRAFETAYVEAGWRLCDDDRDADPLGRG